jgi:hypothetical protein
MELTASRKIDSRFHCWTCWSRTAFWLRNHFQLFRCWWITHCISWSFSGKMSLVRLTIIWYSGLIWRYQWSSGWRTGSTRPSSSWPIACIHHHSFWHVFKEYRSIRWIVAPLREVTESVLHHHHWVSNWLTENPRSDYFWCGSNLSGGHCL